MIDIICQVIEWKLLKQGTTFLNDTESLLSIML